MTLPAFWIELHRWGYSSEGPSIYVDARQIIGVGDVGDMSFIYMPLPVGELRIQEPAVAVIDMIAPVLNVEDDYLPEDGFEHTPSLRPPESTIADKLIKRRKEFSRMRG